MRVKYGMEMVHFNGRDYTVEGLLASNQTAERFLHVINLIRKRLGVAPMSGPITRERGAKLILELLTRCNEQKVTGAKRSTAQSVDA